MKFNRLTDGTVLWSYQQPRGLITSLYAQSGVLYLLTGEGQNSGSICALRSSTGDSLWCQMLHADPEGATLG
ncbi:MAG TPA: hypothetical protein VFV38_23000 [Ktedonobacteraceae bacterium]|nr:hypothetical protein [Ktedonobacteraceae bacterium]